MPGALSSCGRCYGSNPSILLSTCGEGPNGHNHEHDNDDSPKHVLYSSMEGHRDRPCIRIRSAAVVVPVLAAGIRRSEQLALSLSARGFDTRCVPAAVTNLRFRAMDWALAGTLLAAWGLWVFVRLG